MWMAVDDEKIIAYYSLKTEMTKDCGSKIYGFCLNIWGRGLAKDLFQHALERSRCTRCLVLENRSGSKRAKFLRKDGREKSQ